MLQFFWFETVNSLEYSKVYVAVLVVNYGISNTILLEIP